MTAPATVIRTDAWFTTGRDSGKVSVPVDDESGDLLKLLCSHFRWESKKQTSITVCYLCSVLCVFLPAVDFIPAFFACIFFDVKISRTKVNRKKVPY